MPAFTVLPLVSAAAAGMEEVASMEQEIVQGLVLAAPKEADLARYYQWAQTIGEKRVNHIVSNKKRAVYDRAAQVLGALAEAVCVRSGRKEAQSLLLDYYQTRYHRYSAFRKEVKEVVSHSPLLLGAKL